MKPNLTQILTEALRKKKSTKAPKKTFPIAKKPCADDGEGDESQKVRLIHRVRDIMEGQKGAGDRSDAQRRAMFARMGSGGKSKLKPKKSNKIVGGHSQGFAPGTGPSTLANWGGKSKSKPSAKKSPKKSKDPEKGSRLDNLMRYGRNSPEDYSHIGRRQSNASKK